MTTPATRPQHRSMEDRMQSVLQAVDIEPFDSEFTNDVKEIVKELMRLQELHKRRVIT